MQTDRFDVIIVGSGAGGGTMAHALAPTGARILIVERGDVVPQEPENWDPDAVWRQLRYRATERWLDADGQLFQPYTHYNVGGNSKYWGSVLYRLRREDFDVLEHEDGVSPASPITYEALAPYYDRAERLYQVHGQHDADPVRHRALGDALHLRQVDDLRHRVRDGGADDERRQEVEDGREDDRLVRRQRPRCDRGGRRIRRVVEAVREIERDREDDRGDRGGEDDVHPPVTLDADAARR